MFSLTFRSIYSMKSLFLPTLPLHIPPHRLFHHPPFCIYSSSPPLPPHRLFNHRRAIRRCRATSGIRFHGTMPPEGPDPPPDVRKSLSGEIHVIIGPMFAGKTTALLHRVHCAIENGKSVVMVKSDKDTRYGMDSVVSHDGLKLPCFALPELSILRTKMGDEAYNLVDIIGIDEAQFFEDLYDFCRIAADHDGKIVIVAGLDGDYLRRRFGSVLDIIPLADSLTKLTSRCELCGRPAFFTLRKTEHTEKEVIGGADVYMPVCRRHYVGGQVVIETARHLLEARKTEHEQCQEVEPVSSC